MTPSSKTPVPQFPNHTTPRVWFITSALSPVGLAVAQEVLKHGDLVATGNDPGLPGAGGDSRSEALLSLKSYAEDQGWEDRLRIINIDPRYAKIFNPSMYCG